MEFHLGGIHIVLKAYDAKNDRVYVDGRVHGNRCYAGWRQIRTDQRLGMYYIEFGTQIVYLNEFCRKPLAV